MKDVEKILTEGLLAGYLDGETIKSSVKVGMPVFRTAFGKDGAFYYDEWIAKRTGGGQEIVETSEGKKFTRLYGGGVVKPEVLAEIGVTEKEITMQLQKFLQKLREKTRLFEDCYPNPDGDWRYQYSLILSQNQYKDIPLTVGIETIRKIIKAKEMPVGWSGPSSSEKLVFAHAVILSSLE